MLKALPIRLIMMLAVLGAVSFGALAHASIPDPDHDGDLKCPKGAKNKSYCTEDERAPKVKITPGSVRVRHNRITLSLRCTGAATTNCRGTLRIGAGRKFRTTLCSRGISLKRNRTIRTTCGLGPRGRTYVRNHRRFTAQVRVQVRQSDSRRGTSTRRITVRR